MDPQATHRDPLIMTMPQLVIALDPLTGARIWEHRVEHTARRLFVVGRRLLIAFGSTLEVIDMADGHAIGSVDVGFEVNAGLVSEDGVILAGLHGAVCLNADGSVRWRAVEEAQGGWLNEHQVLVGRNAKGEEMWQSPAGSATVADNVGMALGKETVQPDNRGRR